MDLYTTVQAYFPHIESACGKEVIDQFRACEYTELHKYHWTIGLWIRNTLLETEQSLGQAFLRCNITNKDDMSALILRLFYIYEQEMTYTI